MSDKQEISPRQELARFVDSGELRYALERRAPKLTDAAIDLAVTVIARYCENKHYRKKVKP